MTDLSSYISQTSTGNLGNSERVRFLEFSREACIKSHDWTFFHEETDLLVTLKSVDNIYSTASLPSNLRPGKIRSIFYVPNETEYIAVDENEFFRNSGKLYTVGEVTTSSQIRLKNVDGADADSDVYLADQATSSSATTVVISFLGSPDVPRPILFTPGGTTGDVAAGNIVIVGTDMYGNALTENVALTANQTATSTSTGSYRTITSITFPQMDGDGATFDVGTDSTVALRIRYIRQPTAYTASDTTVTSGFPDDMDEVIVLGAVYRIFLKFNRDLEQTSLWKQEYQEALNAAWSNYGRDLKAQQRYIKPVRATTYNPISKTRFSPI